MINLVVRDCAQCIFKGHKAGLGHTNNSDVYGCWAKAYLEPYTDHRTHFKVFTKEDIGSKGWALPDTYPNWCCLREPTLLTLKQSRHITFKSEYLEGLRQRAMNEFSERLDRILALWNAEEVMSVELKIDLKPSVDINIAEGRTTKRKKRAIEYSLVYRVIKGLWRLWQKA